MKEYWEMQRKRSIYRCGEGSRERNSEVFCEGVGPYLGEAKKP